MNAVFKTGNDQPPPAKTNGFNSWALVFRVVVVCLLLSSIWLLWWSYNDFYMPRLKASRETSATVAGLTAEVESLDQQWPQAAIEDLDKKFDQVDPRLFTDQSALENWLTDLRARLPALGLDIKATFEKTVVHSTANKQVLVIPTTVFIEVLPVTNSPDMPTPYQRLLRLTQQFALQKKRADITELSADSGTDSVGRAVIGLNFWAGGKESQ